MKQSLFTILSASLSTSLFGRRRKGEKQSPEFGWFTLDHSRLDSDDVLM